MAWATAHSSKTDMFRGRKEVFDGVSGGSSAAQPFSSTPDERRGSEHSILIKYDAFIHWLLILTKQIMSELVLSS